MNKTDPWADSSPTGRIVHDERGQAVWEPKGEARTGETLMRMLKPDELSLLRDAAEELEGADLPFNDLQR